jgi:hypothetical protein
MQIAYPDDSRQRWHDEQSPAPILRRLRAADACGQKGCSDAFALVESNRER